MTLKRAVTIHENGRSGQIVYREAGGELAFYWEFSGGDIVASVHVGTDAEWRAKHRWAADRRAEILRFVGAEIVRQKAPSCVVEIDETDGWLNLRGGQQTPVSPTQTAPGFSYGKWQALRTRATRVVLILAVVFGGIAWVTEKLLMIDPGKGTPIGLSVRTDRHIATLIQTLEPYTASLNRDHSKDTYAISLFIVPLDGAAPRLVPISGGYSGNSLGLVKVLGSDGRTLWFDVNGLGGVDLVSFERLSDAAIPAAPPAGLKGAPEYPIAPRPEAYLAAGFFSGPDTWLGLCSAVEIAREFRAGQWLRAIVHAEDARQMRQFHRATVGDVSGTDIRKILSMAPLADAEYLNAAFLRMDDQSVPVRLADPDGALMIYTSAPGSAGTLVVARVDTDGRVLWTADTGIDRFLLQQILPGESSFVFVGTRPPVPDKVAEPLIVNVDNRTGTLQTWSLWQ